MSSRSKKTPQVSVIIVVKNGLSTTKKCLQSLLPEKVDEIIIVDNASADGTASFLEELAKRDKRVTIITNNFNNGFAGANNQGFAQATGQFILFLNNDTIVKPNFLEPLVTHLQKEKKTAAVQPLILFPNGSIDSIGSYLTITGFLYHKAHRQMPRSETMIHDYVYSLKGACMLWKRSILKKVGLFDDSYFAYFEETDLCHRAINMGYRLLYCSESSIVHLGGFTSNTMNRNFVQYHNYKNRIATYFRHLPFLKLVILMPVHLVLCEGFVLFQMKNNFAVAVAVQKGIVRGIYNGVIDRLKLYREKRRLIDRYIKHPDLGYYKALFSSLEGYEKIW